MLHAAKCQKTTKHLMRPMLPTQAMLWLASAGILTKGLARQPPPAAIFPVLGERGAADRTPKGARVARPGEEPNVQFVPALPVEKSPLASP